MSYPILKPNSSWFSPTLATTTRSIITAINIVDIYTPTTTPTDSWDASVAQDGSIMCYVEDTILTIAGNGTGKIMANENSDAVFCDLSGANDFFTALTAINGINILDTSNATTMRYMFNKASALATLDVSTFNTSKCKNFTAMFQSCSSLTEIDVSNWDTSSCTNMSFMFWGCSGLTSIDIADWDVSKVTSFDHFLCKCSKLSSYDVSKWNVTSACTSLYAIFHSTKVTSIDVSGWDTSNVITFGQVFESMTNLDTIIGLETWDTSNGIDFTEMFSGCQNIKSLNLSNFDTRKANSGVQVSGNGGTSQCTYRMFYKAYRLEKVILGENFTFAGDGTSTTYVGTLNTPQSQYVSGATGNWYTADGTVYAVEDIPNLTAATYYSRMPKVCLKPNSSWFTPNVETVTRASITTINIVDSYTPADANTVTDSWYASENKNGGIMCYVEGTVLTIAGNGSGTIALSEDARYTFSNANEIIDAGASVVEGLDLFSSVTAINGLELLDTSAVTAMDYMFHRCKSLVTVDVSTFDTSNVTSMSHMFGDVLNGSMALTSINFGEKFVKSTVVDLSYMLYYCSKLATLNIDDWDISNVVNISNFSRACSKLTSFGANNLRDWDFGNVVDMSQAFRGLLIMPKLEIENWNVSKVKDMYCLFCQNEKMFPTLDLRNWDVSSVERMDFVFWGCKSMTSINCAGWDVGNVKTFDHFIARCGKITSLDTTGWNVGLNCENLNAIFHNYQGTELDIRGWDTRNVTVFCQMFDSCTKLRVIHGLGDMDTSSARDFTQFSWSTTQLDEMDLSKVDTTHVVDDYPLSANGSFGDGLSGMFASGTHKNLKKIVLGKKFSFYGAGDLTDACSAVLPTTVSGYYYDIDGTQYTKEDIKAMANPAGTYYTSMAYVEEAREQAKYEADSKKYISLNTMRKYHDMQNAAIDTKLNAIREEFDNIDSLNLITTDDIDTICGGAIQ